VTPLPVTVISGYLGSGKTSLINHVLSHAEGRRIMVLVNDFGELNIDAELLVNAAEDTLILSNGCVCCTMGGDLLFALADVLDRRPRPDCLLIEASGVAQPAKIAAVAQAEPEMRYGGVVTMVDAMNITAQLADPMIGAQVADQLRNADLLLVTKSDLAEFDAAQNAVAVFSKSPVLVAPSGAVSIDLILERPEMEDPIAAGYPDEHNHNHEQQYASWSATGGTVDHDRLVALLNDPPEGLYRLKGQLVRETGAGIEAQLVGRTWSIHETGNVAETKIVAIGIASIFDVDAFDNNWLSVLADKS
jgi:G3E family GTPase